MNRPFIACNHGVQSILDAITWFGQVYCTQQTGVLTRAMTLRAIQATEVMSDIELGLRYLLGKQSSNRG